MPSPPTGSSAGPNTRCPQCGTLLAMESRFCGNCGAVLAAPPAPPAPEPPPPQPEPPPEPVAAPPPAAARPMMKTMVGVPDRPQGAPAPAPFAAPGPAVPSSPAVASSPVADAAPSPARNPMAVVAANKTMMGVALVPPAAPAASPQAPSPGAPQGPASVRSANRTMMGAVAPPLAQPVQSAAPGGMVQVANASKTMMGMNLADAPAAVRSRVEPPPMMGGPSPGVPPDTLPPGTANAPSAWAPQSPGPAIDSIPGLARRRRSPVVPLVVGGLALLAIGAIAAAIHFHGGSSGVAAAPLDAQVVTSADGALAMQVTLAGMPAGTTVRAGAQSAALDAQGHARLPLAAVGTSVGAIDVPVEVTPPNASAFTRTARIVIAYRVEPDLSQLAGDQPSLRLVFHVQPGARLEVNGQPVVTDAHTGLGAATIDNVAPLPIDGRDALESSFAVRVRNADGTVAESTYQLRVPRTPLRLDRPPVPTTTTASSIVVRGLAPGARRVALNGAPLPVDASGAFQTAAPLPQPGHFAWTLVAYSTQGAPALARLDVTRAAAGDRAAETAFLAGSTAGATELAHAALHAGTKVRLRGRVLGAPREYEGGQTFQLVVDAPACGPSHCLAWVDTEPGIALSDGATVEVAGTVTGDRAAVTASGRRTDPVIHAAFVL